MNTIKSIFGVLGLLVCVLSCALPTQAGITSISLAGDSTVTDSSGWGGALQGFLQENVQVNNQAQSGRSTKSFINEGHWQTALNLNADYVFIQFGHNDQKLNRDVGTYAVDNPPNVTPGALDLFRGNLRRMVDEVRALGGTPVLVTSVARRSRVDDGMGGLMFNNEVASLKTSDEQGNCYSLRDYADATIAVGSEKKVAVIDLNRLSLDLYKQMLNNSEDISTLGPAGDNTHLNATGALAIAELVAKAIPNALPNSDLTSAPEPSTASLLATLALFSILGRGRRSAPYQKQHHPRRTARRQKK